MTAVAQRLVSNYRGCAGRHLAQVAAGNGPD